MLFSILIAAFVVEKKAGKSFVRPSSTEEYKTLIGNVQMMRGRIVLLNQNEVLLYIEEEKKRKQKYRRRKKEKTEGRESFLTVCDF